MIGVRKIIVDGFGHAVDSHVKAASQSLLVDLVGRVLRVVAAYVKEIADVVGLENFKQPVHVFGGLFRFFLEIQFVAAGAQCGSGRVF